MNNKYFINQIGDLVIVTLDKNLKNANAYLIKYYDNDNDMQQYIKNTLEDNVKSGLGYLFDDLNLAMAKSAEIILCNNISKYAPLNAFGMTILNSVMNFYAFNKDDGISDDEVLDAMTNMLDCQNKVDYSQPWSIKPETKLTYQKIMSNIPPKYKNTLLDRIRIYTIIAPEAPFSKMVEMDDK